MILGYSISSLPQKLSANIQKVCLTKFGLIQTSVYEEDIKILSDFASKDFPCSHLWRIYSIHEEEKGYYINAEQLYHGKGKLINLSPDVISNKDLSFDTFFRIPNKISYHETFVDLGIQAGIYQLQIHGKNDRPGPVKMELFGESTYIGSVEFQKNDNSWETKTIILHPLHWPNLGEIEDNLTVVLRFTNQEPHRTADIAWLKIIPLSITE